MGKRALLVGLLLLAVVVTLPLALRSRESEPAQYELVVRQSAAAVAGEAGVDLEATLGRAAEEALAELPHRSRVRIEVRVDPAETIPELGVGGRVGAAGVEIFIERPLRLESVPWLRRTLARELHHAVRLEQQRLRSTLLQLIVTEGLADHFARELDPGAPRSPWTEPLSAAQEAELWARAKAQGDRPYDHAAWFSERGSMPPWAGYRLAYRVVGEYLERTGRTAAEAAADHPSAIVAAYEE